MKSCGILIPTFSTRRQGDLGIGDTLALKKWIAWAAEHHVGFLQLLPINENGSDESPYSGISSVALDPVYLAFEPEEIPCLVREDIDAVRATLAVPIKSNLADYTVVRSAKNQLLEISYARFAARSDAALTADFKKFQETHSAWIPDYCLFKLLIEINGKEKTWDQWPEENRCPDAARKFISELRKHEAAHIESRLEFFAYVQWLCFRQWGVIREYADECGVKLMGDVPIGISFHSADVFFNRSIFHTNWFGGTAPEGYSAENPFIHEWGQNWGVPLYDWDAMAETGFAWWRSRISHLTEIFRMFRIDHILGFYRIYGFPWHPRENHEFLGLNHDQAAERTGGLLPKWFLHPDDTPEHKQANLAEGDHRLRTILDAAGQAEVIAEDLGWVPEYVRPHLAELGVAGYRIPHWDSYEDGTPVMGDIFPECSFAAFSTHDHDSLCATWENCRMTVENQMLHPTDHGQYAAASATHSLNLLAGFSEIPIPEDNHWPPYSDAIHWRLIKSLLGSNSRYAVLMVTDLFSLKSRINAPGTHGGANWRLRLNLTDHQMAEHGRLLSNLIQLSGRAAKS